MRTKSPLIVAVLTVAALAVLSQPSAAQRGRSPSRGSAHASSGGSAHAVQRGGAQAVPRSSAHVAAPVRSYVAASVRSHVGMRVGFGGLMGWYYDPWLFAWDAQWYPPYGYPPGGLYPPYRYRMVDTSAEVRVQVEPSSAEVYVDGYLAGNVSNFDGFFHRLYLSPGAHEIIVYQEGFRSLVRRMYFSPNSSLRIREKLERLGPGEPNESRPVPVDDPQGLRDAPPEPAGPPPTRDEPPQSQAPRRMPAADVSLGQVSVRVQPLDADIVIDGELWQRAQGLDRLAISLPVGPHRVDVRKPGFVPFTTEVAVKAGETVSLNVSLSERQ